MLALRINKNVVIQGLKGGEFVFYNPETDSIWGSRPWNPLVDDNAQEIFKSQVTCFDDTNIFIVGKQFFVSSKISQSTNVVSWNQPNALCIKIPKAHVIQSATPSPFFPEFASVLLDSGDVCVNAFSDITEQPFEKVTRKFVSESQIQRCLYGYHPSVLIGGTSNSFVTLDIRSADTSDESIYNSMPLDMDLCFLQRCSDPSAYSFLSIHSQNIRLWDQRLLKRSVATFPHLVLQKPTGYDTNGDLIAVWGEDPSEFSVLQLVRDWKMPPKFENLVPHISDAEEEVPEDHTNGSDLGSDDWDRNSDNDGNDDYQGCLNIADRILSIDRKPNSFAKLKYTEKIAPQSGVTEKIHSTFGAMLYDDWSFQILNEYGNWTRYLIQPHTGMYV